MDEVTRLGSGQIPVSNTVAAGNEPAVKDAYVQDFTLKKNSADEVTISRESKSLVKLQNKIHEIVETVAGEIKNGEEVQADLLKKDTQRLASQLGPAFSRKYHSLIESVTQHNLKFSSFVKDIADGIDSLRSK